jgi:hypothetical protein
MIGNVVCEMINYAIYPALLMGFSEARVRTDHRCGVCRRVLCDYRVAILLASYAFVAEHPAIGWHSHLGVAW